MSYSSDDSPFAATHEVTNQPSPLGDYDPLARDAALREGLERHALWAYPDIETFSRRVGRQDIRRLGDQANRFVPELVTHDRFGRRQDAVEFHPAWHRLMDIGVAAEIHCLPWKEERAGAHVARIAKHFLLSQTEAGVLCPLTMTFAAVPALRHEPGLAETWIPRLLSSTYDPSFQNAGDKKGALMGMAMTEKQGGSDVRANTTRAVAADTLSEPRVYRLTGHKWFCSAPMSDAFLTLAYTDAGLTCFLVPRFLDDGAQNPFHIQRLKRKLGNRSNASSEIEYRGTWAWRVGPEGRGIPTILDMVSHTRLDCVSGSAGMMRRAVGQAIHHAGGRSAFGRPLREQPLMAAVLADLAVESEAATALTVALAAAYDRDDDASRAFCRIATPIAKYWVCKRGIAAVAEAMECLGGNGYVEESILPRLYREMPVNSIWEGSGNIMCLDVLRALGREPETADALWSVLDRAKGMDRRYDKALGELRSAFSRGVAEVQARHFVERVALLLQHSQLLATAPGFMAEAFAARRLGSPGLSFGAAGASGDEERILERAWG